MLIFDQKSMKKVENICITHKQPNLRIAATVFIFTKKESENAKSWIFSYLFGDQQFQPQHNQ